MIALLRFTPQSGGVKMIQQVGQPITFEAFYVAAQVGKTGLTVTVDVYQPDGTQIVTAAAATPTGGGLYRYPLANPAYTGGYRAIFHTTDTTVDQRDIPSLWEVGVAGVANLDAAVSTRLAASAYTAQTGDAFARIGAAGAGLTALGDTRIANLDYPISVTNSQIQALILNSSLLVEIGSIGGVYGGA